MHNGMLDPVAIPAQLGFHDPLSVTPVSGGRDTAIWRVEVAGAVYALRVFRPEQQPVIGHEVAAMQAARAGGIPVPEIHAVAQWQGQPALLLSWHAGHTVAAALWQQPERAFELGVLCGDMLARLHAVPAPEGARSWLGGRGLVEPWLTERLAASGAERLLHLDFHPLNLLTDGQSITAVIDWTNARSGDPRADLARSISILRLDTGELSAQDRAFVRQWERGLRHGYGPVAELAPFLAWAAAFMLDDVRERLDANPTQRQRVERWRAAWAYRAAMS